MMSHQQLREAIMSRVALIPEVTGTSLYEFSAENIPATTGGFASLWREETAAPAPDEPLGPLGRYDYRVEWTLRVYLQNVDDAGVQARADHVTEEVIDRFAGGDPLTVPGPDFQVDTCRVTAATVDARETSPQLVVVEVNLTTTVLVAA